MPSIVFMNASSNDEPIELDLTKATKKDVYDAFKKSCKQARKDQELKKMSHLIKHYIENEKLIPMLLDFGWIVQNDTWTDCPLWKQELIQKWYDANYGE